MNPILYIPKINSDIKKIASYNLWYKNKNTIPNKIVCFDSSIITKDGWYYKLQDKLKHNITVLNNEISQKPIYNETFYNEQKLAADTMARIIYENAYTIANSFLLIRFRNISRYEKVDIRNDKTNIVTRCVYTESYYNPYHLRAFFNFVQNFQMIENTCRLYNINMVWTSSCYFIRNLPRKFLKKFLNTNCFFVAPGKNYHQKVAKKFQQVIGENSQATS